MSFKKIFLICIIIITTINIYSIIDESYYLDNKIKRITITNYEKGKLEYKVEQNYLSSNNKIEVKATETYREYGTDKYKTEEYFPNIIYYFDKRIEFNNYHSIGQQQEKITYFYNKNNDFEKIIYEFYFNFEGSKEPQIWKQVYTYKYNNKNQLVYFDDEKVKVDYFYKGNKISEVKYDFFNVLLTENSNRVCVEKYKWINNTDYRVEPSYELNVNDLLGEGYYLEFITYDYKIHTEKKKRKIKEVKDEYFLNGKKAIEMIKKYREDGKIIGYYEYYKESDVKYEYEFFY